MYPQSYSPAQQVDFSLMLVFVFSAVVLVVLTLVTCWFIWRYHHTRNPTPTDIRGNMTAEVLWTVIPFFMVMGLFYYGWTGFKALRTVPRDAMDVQVTARMFSWTFTYANGKQSPYLAVPVGKPVKLDLRSVDVIHSFYAPAFRIKMDTVPGMNTYAWFRADRAGTYDVYCAEYCGTGHSKMLTTIQAIEIIRGCQGLDLIGCDLVEVSPPYDTTGNTSLLGANLLYEMLCVLPGVAHR